MDLNREQQFEALKMRFEDQVSLLRYLSGIDQKLFFGYCTLQLLLASWLADHGPSSSAAVIGILLANLGLTIVAFALIALNQKRREEVTATVRNLNEAFRFGEIGYYMPERAINAPTELRLWRKWYFIGMFVSLGAVFLVAFKRPNKTPDPTPMAGAPLSNLSLSLMLIASNLSAADWPRWLGPSGDNIAPDDGRFVPDLSKWNVAWKGNVGRGYSVVTIADGRAFTLGHDEKSQETVSCFDAASGKELWKFSYAAQLLPNMHPGGPNASPAVVGNRVITVSKDGQVFCLTADKGAKLWQANLTEVMRMAVAKWGFASTPVIYNGQVLFGAGKIAALDLETGKTLWISKADLHPGYATPVIFAFNGQNYIASLDGKGFAIFSAKDGAEVARHPFKALYDMAATTPIVFPGGTRIFISANLTGEMVGFDGKKLSSLWTTRSLKNNMNNCVVFDGALYGIDGKENYAQAKFAAVNVADGKLRWAKESFGYGTVIGVGKTLLALNESGELVAIQPSPTAYREISRRQVLGKTCWTNPVYANGRIYVRNDRGDVQCLTAK